MVRYTWQIITYFNSRIWFKIILPFTLLTLIVAAIGTYLSSRLVADSLEERFTRQLIEAGNVMADGLAQREQLHLATSRAIAFTTGIDEAILTNDQARLQNLLFPLVANDNIDRVDVINADGLHLLTIYRPPGTNTVEDYLTIKEADVSDKGIVNRVLAGMVDSQGDKYVALTTVDGYEMFLTAGPIKQGDQTVGVVLVGSYIQDLLGSLRQTALAEVSFYDLKGRLIDTTILGGETTAATLSIAPEDIQPLLASEGELSPRRSVSLAGYEYDLLYGIFWARGEPLALYSVGMSTSFMVPHRTTALRQMLIIVGVTLFFVFGIGYFMTHRISDRLQHLMENAMAVASGDFTRRTQISTSDEIGQLARSLDHMTVSLANYTDKLQDRIDELIALYESSSAVTIKSSLNLDQVLQAITSSVKGAIRGTSQVTIHLLEKDGQTLVPRASAPQETAVLPTLTFGPEKGLRELLAIDKPKVVNTSVVEAYSQDPVTRNGTTDVVIASLVAGQETIGMLTLAPDGDTPHTELLDEDKERLLGTLVNQAAIAIKNAQLFEATQQAYEELRQLDDLKTEFINIAAHELRTPLGAMMGYASFAQKRVPSKLQKTMDFLVASTLRMRTMVDAMLTIQRLDAGTAFVRLRSVNIQDIFRKTLADFQLMAELQGHVVSTDFPDELPPIQADPEKIDLIFSNLLSNAIKFTPEGGRIEITIQDHEESVLVSVCDNGVGIAEEEHERIFDRFYQVPVEHIAGHGGMGIGLTTVKHLIELHGGEIWLESKVGQGSTFFVELPKTVPVDSSDTPTSVTVPLVETGTLAV